MFSPKKLKVSKKDLKKAIVNANDRLRSANTRMELSIESGKDKLKNIESDHDSYRKALEDLKEMQVYADNELEGTQIEISETQTSVKKALSKFAKLTEESNSLEQSNKDLKGKSDTLTKSIALLEKRKEELDFLTVDIKEIREEAANGQETLELLAREINDMEIGVESYVSRKRAAEGEFGAFKVKIEREKATDNKVLENIKDKIAQSTLACGREMGRLDKAIAERMSELKDMDMIMQKKTFELSTVQSYISVVENKVEDAEKHIEYIVSKEKEQVSKIRDDFKGWKIDVLDEVARLKIKGKLDNINQAGLKEVLGG